MSSVAVILAGRLTLHSVVMRRRFFSASGLVLPSLLVAKAEDEPCFHSVHMWDIQTGKRLKTFLRGPHTCIISASPTRELVATGSEVGKVRVLDWASARVVFRQSISENEVEGLDFSPDGQYLGAVSLDRAIL